MYTHINIHTTVKHFDHTFPKVFTKSLLAIWIQIYFIKFQNCHDRISTVMSLTKGQKLLDLSSHETMSRSFKEHGATYNATETNTKTK